jgi:hypothetical protein
MKKGINMERLIITEVYGLMESQKPYKVVREIITHEGTKIINKLTLSTFYSIKYKGVLK